eukprot:6638816-Alexandrium_andersonii.AAC.1
MARGVGRARTEFRGCGAPARLGLGDKPCARRGLNAGARERHVSAAPRRNPGVVHGGAVCGSVRERCKDCHWGAADAAWLGNTASGRLLQRLELGSTGP